MARSSINIAYLILAGFGLVSGENKKKKALNVAYIGPNLPAVIPEKVMRTFRQRPWGAFLRNKGLIDTIKWGQTFGKWSLPPLYDLIKKILTSICF